MKSAPMRAPTSPPRLWLSSAMPIHSTAGWRAATSPRNRPTRPAPTIASPMPLVRRPFIRISCALRRSDRILRAEPLGWPPPERPFGRTLLSELVSLRNEGDVAVITIDNPPVNALSHAMRSALVEALSQARADAGVKAIVIVCAGRTFIAGADIAEFGKPVRAPTTLDVIAAIEASEKPVVAALHGTPLGGGLEVALACHYRVAAPGTRPGLPEIKLGLMPGAGGTQRLPRLIGMDKVMGMILSGDQISATEAREAGLVDAVVEGDLTAGAVAFARGKAGLP